MLLMKLQTNGSNYSNQIIKNRRDENAIYIYIIYRTGVRSKAPKTPGRRVRTVVLFLSGRVQKKKLLTKQTVFSAVVVMWRTFPVLEISIHFLRADE